MAELSEEPLSDHSDESMGIPYYSDSTSGGTLSLTSITEGSPATLIPRNDDNIERIKEWVAWVDGTGDFPLAADEPKNPVYESFLEHTSIEHSEKPAELLGPDSHTNFLPIKPRRLPVEAKQRAFARWLQSRGPWDVLRHQSPPACLEGHILEKTWWENADLHFPLYGTGEVGHSQFVAKVLQRSATAPLHKITVIIAVETNIHGFSVGVHEIPLEKLFHLYFDLHCRCDLFQMKVVMKARAACKNPVDGERTLCKPAHPRLSDPLLLLLDFVFEDLKNKEFKDARTIKDTLDFYGLGFPYYYGPPRSERRQDGQKILDAPEDKRQKVTHQILAKYAAAYVERECLYRKNPDMSNNWVRSLFKQSFLGVNMDIPNSHTRREKYYGQYEVDMSEWICMLEGHVHDGASEEIVVQRVDMRLWTKEQIDEYERKEALENGWTEEDVAEWRPNLKVVHLDQADADDEMTDATDSDDEDDDDDEEDVTATNYRLTPRVLRALKKSLPPHLVEALKKGSKNAAENAQVSEEP
ncbi:hypothetical protein KCU65_g3027, partial [Aureobasidium melanogenum]